jgi:hypothetical protein
MSWDVIQVPQELLVQISQILENSHQIPSNSIEVQTLELSRFLIQILSQKFEKFQ